MGLKDAQARKTKWKRQIRNSSGANIDGLITFFFFTHLPACEGVDAGYKSGAFGNFNKLNYSDLPFLVFLLIPTEGAVVQI